MILQILKHTPSWVFALFFVLVALGALQSRPRRISRARLHIMPVAMLCLSALGVGSSFGADPIAWSAWAIALAAILVLGLGLPPLAGAGYCAETARFAVPGSWQPLALMMCIFFTKYAVAVARAVSGNALLPLSAIATVCAVCGLCSGLFFLRAARVGKAAVVSAQA